MPILKVERVISFSSEDEVHTADNILGNNTSRKWKCKTPGEKNAVLFLQLEKASKITGIDIGNEHSAYIEVLVSRSGNDDDYKTLLVMSTFMSAIESRQSTNINRVRMFKKEDLSKPECEEKWDRIKIVCTQPFNRHVKYGLSFIKFHSNEGDKSDILDTNKKLGKFLLRPDSPNDLTTGAIFARRKELIEEKVKPLTAAAAIRAETSSLLDTGNSPARSPRLLPSCVQNLLSNKKKKKNDSVIKDDSPLKPRNRNELFYTEDEEKPNAKIDRLIDKKNAEKIKKQEIEEKQTPQKNKKRDNQAQEKNEESGKKIKRKEDSEAGASSARKENSKRKLNEIQEHTPNKNKCTRVTKPFDRLLEDVVLVISGIQNPDRAVLRAKVMEMGAKYKPDWDKSCSHLVCAFMNTPKFNQVKGRGKIVTRQWIEECHSQRKKLPWRRYALDKYEKDKDESEEEVWEQIKEAPKSPILQKDNNERNDNDDDDIMEQASDTEDIIEQIKNSNTTPLKNGAHNSPVKEILGSSGLKNEDPYSAETDTDEETSKRIKQIKHKPFDFFKDKFFFVDHNFEDDIEEMLKNYIFIHEGSLTDDLTENVHYILCGKEEAQNLKGVNSNAVCILPDWVVDCHRCRQFIPPDEYFIL